MKGLQIAGGVLGIAALTAPVTVLAQAGTNYYTPPKIKVRGVSSVPAGGAGTVVVKVFVKKSGTPSTFAIVKSTNHADDAAALEIAKKSTYSAAVKGGKTQDAFYDFTLKFTSSGTAMNADTGGIGQYKLMISGGNYSGAKAGLESYLQGHPGDAAAEVQLGVANEFLNQPADAAAAFDKAGTIPPNYAAAAVHAYTDAANASFASKDYPTALGYAKKAVGISPGPFQYNTLGTVENANGQSDAAITDLEKARSLAASDATIKGTEKAKIDVNLVNAYLGAGKPDQAKTVVEEIAKLDPSNDSGKLFFAQYYVKSASAAVAATKYADAAALYEQAASITSGAQAAILYGDAAQAYLKITPLTPYDKAKADADKALAADPTSALANFIEGIVLADQNKNSDALPFLKKADDAAKAAGDVNLTQAVESAIKTVSGGK